MVQPLILHAGQRNREEPPCDCSPGGQGHRQLAGRSFCRVQASTGALVSGTHGRGHTLGPSMHLSPSPSRRGSGEACSSWQVWEHRVDCGGWACLTYMMSKGVRKTRVTPHRELERTSATLLWSAWESGRAVDP